ncbi:MAG TPA: leucyl/phenylalanyl-tRNA--protein transferase [Acidimicrobiia bacterium]|nr:leucyl/phenylalanyl-tRNA--protein transferase [Acidimicrobiia bacterium]
MPIEPPPSRWELPEPDSYGRDDLVAIGADLEPGTLLAAYRRGLFPMHTEDGLLGWWSPVARGVIPINGLVVSKSLRRSRRRYRVTFDNDLPGVIAGCADPRRPRAWIGPDVVAAYLRLGEIGWVGSVETWDEEGALVGGLYGVRIGGLFAGESMFSQKRDASKVALVALVEVLTGQPAALLDVQWVTDHLASLGAIAIGRAEYFRRLRAAIDAPRVPGPWRDSV